MKQLLLFFLPAMLVLSSCDLFESNGKKVTMGKSEVFYKDGATEKEANALGKYLMEIGYFDSTSAKSVQVTKDNNRFAVRFVVDDKKLSTTENANTAFWIMQLGISQHVFNNEPIQLVLVDSKMKEVQKIPSIAEYKAGDNALIYYNNEAFKQVDVNSLASVFKTQGFFSYEGEKNILLTKENGSNVVRMLVNKETIGNNVDAFVPVYQLLLYELKKTAFDNNATTLYLTASDSFQDFKKIPVPTDDEVAAIRSQYNQTTTEETTQTEGTTTPTETVPTQETSDDQ